MPSPSPLPDDGLRVAATARHAVYLERVVPAPPEVPPVLAVLTADAVRVPGGIFVDARAEELPFRAVRPGDPAWVQGGWVRLGRWLRLPGHPVPPRPVPRLPLAVADRVAEFAVIVEAYASPLPAELAGPVDALLRAPTSPTEAEVGAVARGLLGRGPGLTPSGDDVLCGMLVTWAALGDVSSQVVALRDAVARVVRAEASGRTTTVSAGLLWHATRGACVPELADLLAALAEGADGARLAAATWGVAGIGHTSGSDLLRGVGCALSLAAHRRAALS